MKQYEHYTKYKTNYRPAINPVFYKKNWWQIILLTLAAVMIEPFMIYKSQRSHPFTLDFYLEAVEFCLDIAVPFLTILLWLNWRESVKRIRGYAWVGTFEVIRKKSAFLFHYLVLAPGNRKLKVGRSLFEKTRVGNFILIRRNALGNIEEIRKINNLAWRLGKRKRSRT